MLPYLEAQLAKACSPGASPKNTEYGYANMYEKGGFLYLKTVPVALRLNSSSVSVGRGVVASLLVQWGKDEARGATRGRWTPARCCPCCVDQRPCELPQMQKRT